MSRSFSLRPFLSPAIKRRAFAALILFGFAIGSVLFWNDGEMDWSVLALNCVSASAGWYYLHSRWSAKERRALTPKRLEDIFS